MTEKMEELLRLRTWAVQGNSNAPNNLFDWLHADNRYPQHRGREAALALILDLVDLFGNPLDPLVRIPAPAPDVVGRVAACCDQMCGDAFIDGRYEEATCPVHGRQPNYGVALNATSNEPNTLDAIAVMMSEFVDNWPAPKRVDTALKLIAKTLRAATLPTPQLQTVLHEIRKRCLTETRQGLLLLVEEAIAIAALSAIPIPATGEEYQQARTAYLDEFVGEWLSARLIAANAYDVGYSRAALTDHTTKDDLTDQGER